MDQSSKNPGNVAPRPHRLVRRLCALYAGMVLGVCLFLSIQLLPAQLLPGVRAVAAEAITGGLGGIVLVSLLMALMGLAATLLLTTARHAGPDARIAVGRWQFSLDPGFAARVGQACVIPILTALLLLAAWLLWPVQNPAAAAGAAVSASFAFALAFASLISERTMHAFPEPQLPEAPSLRRLLLLCTVLLTAAACVELGRAGSLAWMRWPAMLLIVVPCAVSLELTTRAAARMFLPAPTAGAARAVTVSVVATVLTGGPRAPGVLLRTHLGLDFARSWALSFLSAALLPAVGATAMLCWALSGVKLIDLGQRGIYERFGAPVAVMGPGLHLLLPWPLGRLRPVEYGAIHSLAIGVDPGQGDMTVETVGAEAVPPKSLNRLWESAHPGQAEYLVPSQSTGLQGFQTVSTEISVLYRIGLTDEDALQAVYNVAELDALIREAAGRLVLRYFNSQTLDSVLGAKREKIAEALRAALTADLAAHRAGVDVVSVLIEEIHPPAGAADAYHAVQAAQINASASISDETGRAKRTAGIAQQEAHQLIAASTALAAETLHTANAVAYEFTADRRAYADAGHAFLLERSNRDIVAALIRTPLTILDHRLSAAQAPVMDLRDLGVAAPPDARALTPDIETDNPRSR
jgi:regulator of protease activity HflC (stomatin/prohibitin superfamily)